MVAVVKSSHHVARGGDCTFRRSLPFLNRGSFLYFFTHTPYTT